MCVFKGNYDIRTTRADTVASSGAMRKSSEGKGGSGREGISSSFQKVDGWVDGVSE